MSTNEKKGTGKAYPGSYKLKLVKLHEEEGYSYQYLSEQTGIDKVASPYGADGILASSAISEAEKARL